MLTGKGLEYGGSLIRTEATGYGAVYFMRNMLATQKDGVEGKKVVISGSGNVATHAAEKINQLGGKVLTLSDSEGFIYDPAGIDETKVNWIKDLKNKRRGRISEYAKEFKADAVKLARSSQLPMSRVARDLGVHETVLRTWVRQADVDEGGGPATAMTTEEKAELARLRREVKVLREEREILKKAAAFFAKEKA